MDLKQRIENVMEQMTRAQEAGQLRTADFRAGLLVGVETSMELLNIIQELIGDLGKICGFGGTKQ